MSIAQNLRGWIPSRKLGRMAVRRRRRAALWFTENAFESLEQRALLTTINWTGAAGTADWFTASNWDGGAVPGPADDVAIDQWGAAVQIGSGDVTIHALELSQSLTLGGASFMVIDTASINGGTLTASSGVNTVQGVFSASQNASISASNAGTSFQARAVATLDGTSLIVTGGAQLAFPTVNAYSTSYYNNTFLASGTAPDGTPSSIDLSGLTQLFGLIYSYSPLTIEALAGGQINLSGLNSEINGQVAISADGTGSQIDFSNLPEISCPYYGNSSLSVSNGATILAPQLSSLSQVDISISNTGTLNTAQISSFFGGQISVSATATDFSGLTALQDTDIYAWGGAQLAFPNLTSYSSNNGNTIQASGTASKIDLSALTSIAETSNYNAGPVNFSALDGGQVNLRGLGLGFNRQVGFNASGAGSFIDLSRLTDLTTTGYYKSFLTVGQGGIILAPLLTTLSQTDLTVADTGIFATTQITSFTGGSITANNSQPDFSGITALPDVNLYASNGGLLTFPNLTSYSSSNGNTIQASGFGSKIDLSTLTSIEYSTFYYGGTLTVQALGGGQVDLSGVANPMTGRGDLLAQDPGSLIDLSSLPAITTSNNAYSRLNASNGGTILAPKLTTLDRTTLEASTGGSLSTAQITAFTNGIVEATSVALSFPGLTSLDNLDLHAFGGAQLAFPSLSSYSSTYGNTILANGTAADGTPSTIDLTSFANNTGPYAGPIYVQASGGGQINLSGVTDPISGLVSVWADGAGSQIDLSSLAAISTSSYMYSTLNVSNGGSILVPKLTTLSQVSLAISDASNLNTSQITSFTLGSISVSNNRPDFSGLTSLQSVSLYASNGGLLAFPNLTSFTAPGSTFIQASGTAADGTPSKIDLSTLTRLADTTDAYASPVSIQVSGGALIDLSGLGPDLTRRISAVAVGQGSTIDFSHVTSINTFGYINSYIQTVAGGSILTPRLTSLSQVDLYVGQGGQFSTAIITAFTQGSITTYAENLLFPGITSLENVDLFASSGGLIGFPNLISYSASQNYSAPNNFIRADGTATDGTPSTINLGALTTLTGPTNNIGNSLYVQATGGGQVNFGSLTSITAGQIAIDATGTGSQIDLTGLAGMSTTTYWHSSLSVSNRGNIVAPQLTTLSRTDLTVRDTGTLSTAQIGSVIDGWITVTSPANPVDFSGIRTLDNSSVYATYGAQIAFPNLTSYTATYGNSFQASATAPDGTPSKIDLGSLTTLNLPDASSNPLMIQADNGGQINLSGIRTALNGHLSIYASSAGSTIDLSQLPGLVTTGYNVSSIQVLEGARLALGPQTVSLSGVSIYMEGTGTIAAGTLQLGADCRLVGNGTISANLDSAGQINVGPYYYTGTLTILGNFTQQASATLVVRLGGVNAGSQYDQLFVAGTAALDGTLNVSSFNGFLPLPGDSFQVAIYNSHTGTFAQYIGLTMPDGSQLEPLVGDSSVTLSLLATAPAVTQQPSDTTALIGDVITLNAAASGNPTPSVQWQVSADQGLTWTEIPGANQTSYAFTVVLADQGNQYRALFSNVAGAAFSNPATLTVQANSARFLTMDSTTQGSWKGTYGADGWNVSQDPSVNNPSYPAYATVSITDVAGYTWNPSTSNMRALQQTALNSQDRLAGCWYNADTFSINININDGQVHQVALYALDWSSTVRSETIEVINVATGTVLDTRSLAGFHNGDYLVWNISGNVTFQITNTNIGDFTNAVLSGLFFGGASISNNTAAYVNTDATTQGNWKGVYGSNGWNVSQDSSSNNPTIPYYAGVTFSSASDFTWNASTTNVSALQTSAPGSSNRIAGTWYDNNEFSINVAINDGQTHTVALYALDWDHGNRTETIQVLDADSGAVLDSRNLANFENGIYLVWNIHGNVTFKVINTGPTNAVLSGLFFGQPSTPTASASFLAQNDSTQGTWKGTYGTRGFDVSQDTSANNPTVPEYAGFSVQDAGNFIWNANTSNVRALQQAAPDATNRIAAAWYSDSSFSLNVKLNDGWGHQVALYALDWDLANRTELIQVLDTDTGAVLDTRSLASFQNGVYLVWYVRGNVTFKVTNTCNTNAVLSGLFLE